MVFYIGVSGHVRGKIDWEGCFGFAVMRWADFGNFVFVYCYWIYICHVEHQYNAYSGGSPVRLTFFTFSIAVRPWQFCRSF